MWKVIRVSVHVLYVSFTPVCMYVRQEGLSVTPVYIGLRQWAGTWSSTKRFLN